VSYAGWRPNTGILVSWGAIAAAPRTHAMSLCFILIACGTTTSQETGACTSGAPLTGVVYDISKSRFAFGGPMVKTILEPGGDVQWAGPDGTVLIQSSNGYATAQLEPGAPEGTLPAATNDFDTQEAYMRDYFVGMGVPPCQIERSAQEHPAVLQRAVNGIPVAESVASANFDDDYQTTSEALYWPEIPASVVTAALVLQRTVTSPRSLAALKSMLPSNAQGNGGVFIHHSNPSVPSTEFAAVATYDVVLSDDQVLSFDSNGHAVILP